MIKTREDLKEYLKADQSNDEFKRRCFFVNPKFKYLKILRKTEFHFNAKQKIRYFFYNLFLKRISYRYLTFIPINTCDKGLSIAHLGSIYINNHARIGSFCRIHEMTTIGTTSGNNRAPQIGDYVFVGSGAKIIGDIKIADKVTIGAGAVVVKNIEDSSTTWAGVPAKKISNNDSSLNIKVLRDAK